MNKIIQRYDLWICVLIFLLIIPAKYFGIFSSPDLFTNSFRHLLRIEYGNAETQKFPADKIYLVNLDEQFFEEYQRFPLSRADIGKMVSVLNQLGAKVIGLDMLMDFPSTPEEDQSLANALKNAGNTLVASAITFKDAGVFTEGVFNKMRNPTTTLKETTTSAYTNKTEIDNQIIQVKLYESVTKQTHQWPFAVKALAMYLGVEPSYDNGILTLGDLVIPLSRGDYILLDFPRLPPGFDYLHQFASIAPMELLDLDEDEMEELVYLIKDKIVIVGDTTEVSHDWFQSPVGQVYGVELLAYTISSLLNQGTFRHASNFAEAVVWLIVLLGFIGLCLVEKARIRSIGYVLFLFAYFCFGFLTYIYIGTVFSMAYLLIAIVLGFIVVELYSFMEERKKRTFITGAFSQYLSPRVIDIIVDDPEKLSLGGELRDMTAQFSDLQGFTSISENLSPNELVQLLNEYLTEMCGIISNYDGTIDKFEGDAIIAFWGAPLDQPDHAKLACFATVDMQQALGAMGKELIKAGRPELLARFGMNSGPMVVGNMGSQQRMDYTIMGDAVNLAARLEGVNKAYKTYSMISAGTYEQTKDYIDVRELDHIRVVGKKEPVTIYELLGRKNTVTGKKADVIDQFNSGLTLYQNRDFKNAITQFEKALEIDKSDGPSSVYLDRCKQFLIDSPDANWDGVFTITSKG